MGILTLGRWRIGIVLVRRTKPLSCEEPHQRTDQRPMVPVYGTRIIHLVRMRLHHWRDRNGVVGFKKE